MHKTLAERFEAKYIPEPNSGCWIWIGALEGGGYGNISSGGSRKAKRIKAHRVAYVLYKGEVPEGKDLDHLCRLRCCVNPDHLEPVTRQENIRRSPIAVAANHARRTHCSNGHPLSGDNLAWVSGENRRRCLTCKRAYTIARRAKIRAKGGKVT
jgi:hypothetical protein